MYLYKLHIIIILFISINCLYGEIDSTITSDTTNSNKIEKQISPETKAGTESKVKTENFIKEYEVFIGSFLGALFAALIALYSIRKTNKNNIELEIRKYNTQKKKKENQYCGVLYAIFADLKAHKKIHDNLSKEIDEFLEYFNNKLDIPVDNPFSEIPVEFLKACRIKILEFDQYETTSLYIFSNYLNLTDVFLRDMNLNRVRESRSKITDKQLLIEGMKLYFDQNKNTLEKLDALRTELITKIEEIIKSYPQSDLNFDNNKQDKKTNNSNT